MSSNEQSGARFRGTRQIGAVACSFPRVALISRSQDDGNRLSDETLDKWSRHGIAVHHAGLDTSDRHLIEEWFRKGRLRMLVSTSVCRGS